MKLKDKAFIILVGIAAAIIIPVAIYGVYFAGKTVSYKLFYKDMVRAEITQMVKAESLKEAPWNEQPQYK